MDKFAKKGFKVENFLGTFLTQELSTFLKSAWNWASFDTLYEQYQRILFNSYDGSCYFFGE